MAPTEITAGTIPMSFVLNLLNGTPLDPAGQAEALAKAGIAPVLLDAETARVTTEQFATLYRQLANQLDDELPGMFSRPVHSGSLKFLCLSLLDSTECLRLSSSARSTTEARCG